MVLSSSEEDLCNNSNATLVALRRSVSSASLSSSTASVTNQTTGSVTGSALSFSDWDMLQSIVFENASASVPEVETSSIANAAADDTDSVLSIQTDVAVAYSASMTGGDDDNHEEPSSPISEEEKSISEMATETLASIQADEEQQLPVPSPANGHDSTPWKKLFLTLKRWIVLRIQKCKSLEPVKKLLKSYSRPLELLLGVMLGVVFGIAYSSRNMITTPPYTQSSSEQVRQLLAEINRLRASNNTSSTGWGRLGFRGGHHSGGGTWSSSSRHTTFTTGGSSSTPAFPVYSRYFASATQTIPVVMWRSSSPP